ncbi:unnamed protein product [Oikopleura dioica]|uniref:Exocyst complex component Sec3 PIP2-binding N-terminal domain-containing protein n=1 Tax=Oikopleura dioica TaxID=34765 RepID=E4X521_OIKDI|nr:unnamed protein product [Oikopleura dioica]
MAAIRQALQRDVFTARDERLLGVVHVTKNKSKSKKNNFLCLAVTSEQPVQVSVSVVKKGARNDELYKRHIQWLLTDLKQVEASQNPTEFDLVFDKLYRWEAASESERENFLMNLVKLAKRYLSPTQLSNITFSNINVSTPDRSQVQSDDLSDARIADYQELSDVEQTDLGDILKNCEGALQNAEAFAELLQGNLSSLDGDNMTAIMKSDSDIKDLMKTLDQAINEVVRVESELERYDAMLGSIQTQMGAMKSQQSFIQISDLNQRCLISEIASIVDQLEMPKEHHKALRDADFDSSDGIKAAIAAAEHLSKAMKVELPTGLSNIASIVEQQKLFNELRAKFSKRLMKHLENRFLEQRDHVGEASDRGALKLPKHTQLHKRLMPYRPLIVWLRINDQTTFMSLVATYTESVRCVYRREIRQFRELAENSSGLGLGSSKKLSGSIKSVSKIGGSIKNLSKSTFSLTKKAKKFGSSLSINKGKGMGRSTSMASIGSGSFIIDLSAADRTRFSDTMREVLNEMEPICQEEQKFITDFFNLTAEGLYEGDSFIRFDEIDGNNEAKREQAIEAAINKEIRRLMSDIFGGESDSLEDELGQLIEFGDQLDKLNSLSLLVVLSKRVLREKVQTFLGKLLGLALVQEKVKRSFDRFVNDRIQRIDEYRPRTGEKVGILWFVKQFDDLAQLAETIFDKAERRTDLDRAYKKLLQGVLRGIEQCANSGAKTPSDVIRFQNYHHCFAVLSSLRIEALTNERKETKKLYQSCMESYAALFLGRPLEQIAIFFDGVTKEIDLERPAEEIQFMAMYNKSSLRKVIKEYPGKKVKKGLEELYLKVEKHTAEDDNRLLQVVWREMQEEFIRQYNHYDNLLQQCYSGTGIKMDFTLSDILNYFSEIASSHY